MAANRKVKPLAQFYRADANYIAERIGVTGPQPGSRAPSAPVDLNDECL